MLTSRRAPRYAPFYCEENVWWLAKDAALRGLRAEVAIVTNATRRVAVWSQRAAVAPGAPVVWDYHVVLAVFGAAGWEIWDLDCALGAPLPAARWLDASFPAGTPPHLRPRFRVLPASEYVRVLASDRSHMRDESGHWLAPPPPWAPIGQGPPTLMRLLDLDDSLAGERTDLEGLRARLRVAG